MTTEETELTFIRCPSCRSLVPAVATRCRMCGHSFEADSDDMSADADLQKRKSRVRQRTISVSKEEVDDIAGQMAEAAVAADSSADVFHLPSDNEPEDTYSAEDTSTFEDSPAADQSSSEVFVMDPPLSSVEESGEEQTHEQIGQAEEDSVVSPNADVEGQESFWQQIQGAAEESHDYSSQGFEKQDFPETGQLESVDEGIESVEAGFAASYENVSEEVSEETLQEDAAGFISETETETEAETETETEGETVAEAETEFEDFSASSVEEEVGGTEEKSQDPASVQDASKQEGEEQPRSRRKRRRRKKRRPAIDGEQETGDRSAVSEAPMVEEKRGFDMSTQETTKTDSYMEESEEATGPRSVISDSLGVSSAGEGTLIGWLVNFDQDSKGVSSEIRAGRFFIGKQRLRKDDMVIADSAISTPHCLVISSPEEGLKIQDLMSEQGTFIKRGNSGSFTRVKDTVAVEHGDRLRFGGYEVTVCLVPA